MTTILVSILSLALFVGSAIALFRTEMRWASELQEDMAREHLVP